MNVFVAGATGVLGRAAVPALIAAGHQVRGIARSPEKASQLAAQGAEPVERVDLFDPSSVRPAVAGADAVVHMATNIPPMLQAWRRKAWAANDRLRAEATPILVDAAREVRVQRFVKESVAVFYRPKGDEWIDEDGTIASTRFGTATLAAEQAALSFSDGAGRAGVVLRFGIFYGGGDRWLREGLVTARFGVGPMIGAPDSYQPSINVADAADAVVAALDAPSGIYNVADDPVTKSEWNAAFFEAFGIDRRHRRIPAPLLRAGGEAADVLARSRRISSRRFRAATGWSPRFPDAPAGLRSEAASLRDGAQ